VVFGKETGKETCKVGAFLFLVTAKPMSFLVCRSLCFSVINVKGDNRINQSSSNSWKRIKDEINDQEILPVVEE